MIEVKNLTKRYGDHYAIDHLSFKVDDGQIYGFLGPNGAGKSTTMNIMTGYLAPTDGEVLINGHDILEEPEEAKKTIGYLPELPPVYPDMTIEEYLKFCAELKKVPKKERAASVEEAMKELELTDMKDRLIKNLSKGFRQRVGFAQALIGNPETLILDEPTVGLDPKQILEIRELIRHLGEKHTVILSSHILSEVSEVCDQVLIINKGHFIACDTPERLSRGSGSNVLTVTAEGTKKDVLRALRTVVQANEADLTEEGTMVHARITVPSDADVRSRVSAALFAAKCPIVEMHQESQNLEDIFLMLTAEDDTERAEKKAAKAGRKGAAKGKEAKASEENEEAPEEADEPEAADVPAEEVPHENASVEENEDKEDES
ncbi:MAG: ABC transporter ATP-binding protein [Lachnospiraceae bacterium]|nr:ABC transporter ATP-binding protein [Lachnospiraceae bacterium]